MLCRRSEQDLEMLSHYNGNKKQILEMNVVFMKCSSTTSFGKSTTVYDGGIYYHIFADFPHHPARPSISANEVGNSPIQFAYIRICTEILLQLGPTR